MNTFEKIDGKEKATNILLLTRLIREKFELDRREVFSLSAINLMFYR